MSSIPRPRSHPLPSLFNFRDVGGYRGLSGKRVRHQRLYRSDSLHRLEEDRVAFAALGIRTVIDLRRQKEIDRDGRVPRHPGLAYRHIHPEHHEWTDVPYDERDGVAGYLSARYLELAESGMAGITSAIAVIADAEAAPVVVHCVAGKDRTGVVCGLALALLGVDDSDIAADYELSTAAADRFSAWVRTHLPDTPPVPAPFLSSPAEAMMLFLAGLRQRYGSVERYLLNGGLSHRQVAALRDHLLTDEPDEG